ncbi:hypothetical protein P3T76_001606 [Phytophthora citrophthora]|uniref:Uncharacterized protein n=1 Tax=Phytophthora citrophthora TaxID=4793 RepID=A0AAD9H101_9STRA|nr:hypothetical protein P3T76_001606 [Phytophthora citrophthora]
METPHSSTEFRPPDHILYLQSAEEDPCIDRIKGHAPSPVNGLKEPRMRVTVYLHGESPGRASSTGSYHQSLFRPYT